MKKACKILIPLALVAVLVLVLCMTGCTATNAKQVHLAVGDDKHLGFVKDGYVSGNTSVIRVEADGSFADAVAVGVGKATVTDGQGNVKYLFIVHSSEMFAIFGEMEQDMGLLFYVVMLIPLLIVAMSVYIFIEAPKCGMSRTWALVPFFSRILGILLFIVVRTGRKKIGNVKKRTCPTCGGVHSDRTTYCPVCGTKLS